MRSKRFCCMKCLSDPEHFKNLDSFPPVCSSMPKSNWLLLHPFSQKSLALIFEIETALDANDF